jgi:hypothetical protein
MLPGRTLSGTRHVTVEARVSRQGAAAPQSGDYQSALIPIDPRQSKSIHILIDHVIGASG